MTMIVLSKGLEGTGPIKAKTVYRPPPLDQVPAPRLVKLNCHPKLTKVELRLVFGDGGGSGLVAGLY